MSVRIKRYSGNGIEQPEWVERGFINDEITFDNQTFHYGMNQHRNFADDGVGIGYSLATTIVQDAIPFGTSRA